LGLVQEGRGELGALEEPPPLPLDVALEVSLGGVGPRFLERRDAVDGGHHGLAAVVVGRALAGAHPRAVVGAAGAVAGLGAALDEPQPPRVGVVLRDLVHVDVDRARVAGLVVRVGPRVEVVVAVHLPHEPPRLLALARRRRQRVARLVAVVERLGPRPQAQPPG